MAIPKLIQGFEGHWVGTSTLHCPWPPEADPIRTGDSTLSCSFDPTGAFAKISLVWHENGPQYSEFLICGSSSKDDVSCGWTDSWHLSSEVMRLQGTGMDGDMVDMHGTYRVEGHPEWGWRIAFSRAGAVGLKLEMFNISPEGEEEWAVRAEYNRA